jgi:hypothetical protein
MAEYESILPKVRVQGWRLAYYMRALARARRLNPDLRVSDWVRQACDELAERQLGYAATPRPPEG